MKALLLICALGFGCQTDSGGFSAVYNDYPNFLPIYGEWMGLPYRLTVEPGKVNYACERAADIDIWTISFIDPPCDLPWVVPYKVYGEDSLWVWLEGKKTILWRAPY